MTLEEAIKDQKRPLSVSPMQWMQYVEANDKQEQEIVDNEVKRIVSEENNIPFQELKTEIDPFEKLEIGIQQMVLGCKISIKALQELERVNTTPSERKAVNKIKEYVNNAIAPYLADILIQRKNSYKE